MLLLPSRILKACLLNVGKTIYILLTISDMQSIGSQVTAVSYTFDVANELIYLDSSVTSQNEISLVIKRRVTLAYIYIYTMVSLSNRGLSRATKLLLFKPVLLPIL